MNSKDLQKILKDHKLWLNNPKKGLRADLSGINLSGASLSRVDLYRADLSRANLCEANLQGADIYEVNLSNTIY